jgi:DNA-binding NarL/FixJ family response regulator
MKKTTPSSKLVAHRRIFLVDDHTILRDGLRRLLEAEPDLVVCGGAENAKKAKELIAKTEPEIAIIDISIPGTDGLELVKDLRAHFPHLKLLMLSMHDETLYAERALRAGALGYIMKQAPTELLLVAVRNVLANKRYLSAPMANQFVDSFVAQKRSNASTTKTLSDRELEIVRLIGKGLTTAEMAEELGISGKTVESHRGNLRRKLNLRNGSELLRYALAHSEE